MRLRVLDLDGALDHQSALLHAQQQGRGERIEARDLASRLRIVAGREAWAHLCARLKTQGPAAKGPLVTFYGSGDFHHVTTALIEASVQADAQDQQHASPITVVHFDNHPDWVRFPATHNCGAWVNRALELPQVHRVVTLGVCSDDLVRPQWKMAHLAAVESGQICLFPYQHAPSQVFGSFAPSPSYQWQKGALHWACLEGLTETDCVARLQAQINTEAIYITLDKDVLSPQDAVTNWDQGQMRLETVMTLIKALAGRFHVVGVDVCGDWSAPVFTDPFRWVLSTLDRAPVKPDRDGLARNTATNARLLSLFEDLFSQ